MHFKVVIPSANFPLNISSFSLQWIMYKMAAVFFKLKKQSNWHEPEIVPLNWHAEYKIIVRQYWKGPLESSDRPPFSTDEIQAGNLPTAHLSHREWVAQPKEEPSLPGASFMGSFQFRLPQFFILFGIWAFWHLLGLHILVRRKLTIF